MLLIPLQTPVYKLRIICPLDAGVQVASYGAIGVTKLSTARCPPDPVDSVHGAYLKAWYNPGNNLLRPHGEPCSKDCLPFIRAFATAICFGLGVIYEVSKDAVRQLAGAIRKIFRV